MARIKRGLASHAKHKKLLEQAKGYMMTRHRLVRKAKEAVLHAGAYSYTGRKNKKRVNRRDWILHINGALQGSDMNYSTFIHKLKEAKIELDRKVLSEMASLHTAVFKQIIDKVK